MKKLPYPDYNLDFYEQYLPSKMKLLVVPNKEAKTIKLGVYVDIGSYTHTQKILNTKTMPGLAYFLSKALKHTEIGNLDDLFKQNDSQLEIFVDESYTYYQLTCFDDYVNNLELLLGMVSTFTIKENEVEETRKEVYQDYENYFKNPINSIKDDLRKALYIGSPLKDSKFGTLETIKSIHYNTLKKFYNQYYSVENMTLIVSGNVDPSAISKHLMSLKLTNRFKKEVSEPIVYQESYGSARQMYVNKDYPITDVKVSSKEDSQTSLLALGIKMKPREELYNLYATDVFSYYEILPNYLFGRENKFIDKMYKQNLIEECVETSVNEGSEDCFVQATFLTKNPNQLKQELIDYISLLGKKGFDSKQFKYVLKSYIGQAVMNMGQMPSLIKSIVNTYANHMAYPTLVNQTKSIRKGTFAAFVKELEGLPYSIVIYQK